MAIDFKGSHYPKGCCHINFCINIDHKFSGLTQLLPRCSKNQMLPVDGIG